MRNPKNRLQDLEQKLKPAAPQKPSATPVQSVQAMAFDQNEPIELRTSGSGETVETRVFDHNEPIELRYSQETDGYVPSNPTYASANSLTADLDFGSEAFEVEAFEAEPVTTAQPMPLTPEVVANQEPDRSQSTPLQPEVVADQAQPMPIKSAAPPVQTDTSIEPKPAASPEVATADDFLEDLQAILKGEKTYDGSHKQVVDASPQATQLSTPEPSPPASATPTPEDPANQTSPHEVFDRLAQGLPPKPAPAASPTSTYADAHSVFDRMGKNMTFANSFDLGTITLEQRFDEFDRILDAEKREREAERESIAGVVDARSAKREGILAHALEVAPKINQIIATVRSVMLNVDKERNLQEELKKAELIAKIQYRSRMAGLQKGTTVERLTSKFDLNPQFWKGEKDWRKLNLWRIEEAVAELGKEETYVSAKPGYTIGHLTRLELASPKDSMNVESKASTTTFMSDDEKLFMDAIKGVDWITDESETAEVKGTKMTASQIVNHILSNKTDFPNLAKLVSEREKEYVYSQFSTWRMNAEEARDIILYQYYGVIVDTATAEKQLDEFEKICALENVLAKRKEDHKNQGLDFNGRLAYSLLRAPKEYFAMNASLPSGTTEGSDGYGPVAVVRNIINVNTNLTVCHDDAINFCGFLGEPEIEEKEDISVFTSESKVVTKVKDLIDPAVVVGIRVRCDGEHSVVTLVEQIEEKESKYAYVYLDSYARERSKDILLLNIRSEKGYSINTEGIENIIHNAINKATGGIMKSLKIYIFKVDFSNIESRMNTKLRENLSALNEALKTDQILGDYNTLLQGIATEASELEEFRKIACPEARKLVP